MLDDLVGVELGQHPDLLLGGAEDQDAGADGDDGDGGAAGEVLAVQHLDHRVAVAAEAAARRSVASSSEQTEDDGQREDQPDGELEHVVSSARCRVDGDLGDPQAEVLVDHDDLAAGDQAAVDQQVGGAAGGPVQLEDGAGRQLEQLAHRHPGAADLDGHLHVDAVQQLDAAGLRAARSRRPTG